MFHLAHGLYMMRRRTPSSGIAVRLLYIHSFRPLLAHTFAETERMVQIDPKALTTTADKLRYYRYKGQGRQVQTLRERMGLSRREFADKFGVWTTTVRDWETEPVRMTKQTWEKLFKL